MFFFVADGIQVFFVVLANTNMAPSAENYQFLSDKFVLRDSNNFH